MTQQQRFHTFLNKLIAADLLFAVYKIPGTGKICGIIQKQPEILNVEEGMGRCENGFALFPFDPGKVKSVWIRSEILFDSTNFPDVDPEPVHYKTSWKFEEPPVISREEYMRRMEVLLTDMKVEKVEKVVVSRSIPFQLVSTSVSDLFLKLCNANDKSFSFLLNLPGGIQWVGSSPETLINKIDDTLETVALAGTKKANGSVIKWGQKEMMEQEIVRNHVEDVLTKRNLNFRQSDTTTEYFTNEIAHLKTRYTVESPSTSTWNLLKELHPTPAVCGNPKLKAFELIRKTEIHKRTYYTGFLGPRTDFNREHYFVNLRSAVIFKEHGYIFVGGGITSDSHPASEWDETTLKSRSILDYVE